MKIDINRKTFAVANKTGGVSGPIVKADRSPYGLSGGTGGQYSDHRNGGISCAEDAIEFCLQEQVRCRSERQTSMIRQ